MKTTRLIRGSFGLIAMLGLAAQLAMGQDLYVYPAAGQNDAQLAEDRYACHLWAVDESGFDPSQFDKGAVPRTVRVPVTKNKAEGAVGKGAIVGAVAGGIIGAHDGDAAEGAVVGAVLGTMTGAAIEQKGHTEARKNAEAEAQSIAAANAQSRAELALRKSNYRRALTACLEGRNYTVR